LAVFLERRRDFSRLDTYALCGTVLVSRVVKTVKGVVGEMKRLLRGLEDWMAAAAFAEAGDHRTARDILALSVGRRQTLRKRLQRRRRAETSAPCPRI